MNTNLLNKCISELAEIPEENHKYFGERVLRQMKERSKEATEELKSLKAALRCTAFQVVYEPNLSDHEVAALKALFEEQSARMSALEEELARIGERKQFYSQFSETLEPQVPVIIRRQ